MPSAYAMHTLASEEQKFAIPRERLRLEPPCISGRAAANHYRRESCQRLRRAMPNKPSRLITAMIQVEGSGTADPT